MLIKGPLGTYFETGSEGSHWTIQDVNHIDAKGMYSYAGLHHLRLGSKLEIFYKETSLWKGTLHMIDTVQARRIRYFKQYVKAYPFNPKFSQLCFNGRWIHRIPINIDLGLWHDVFLASEGKYTGELEIEDRILKKNLDCI